MTAMGWFITVDAGEFLAEAGEFLRAEPARNTVVLTVTENLRVKPPGRPRPPAPGSGPDGPLFGWWRPPAVPATESPSPVGAIGAIGAVGAVGAVFMYTQGVPPPALLSA